MGKQSLQFRLFLSVTLVIIAITGVYALLATASIRQDTQRTLHERAILGQIAGNRLDDTIDQSLKQLGQTTAGALTDYNSEPGEPAKQVIQSTFLTLPITPAYISLVDVQGKILWTHPYMPRLIRADLTSVAPLGLAFKSNRPFVSDVLPDLSESRHVVYLGAPLKDADGKTQGFTVAVVDLEHTNMAQFVQPLQLGKTGYAQIVDSSGVILAATGDDVALFTRETHSYRFAELISKGQTTQGTCHGCHGDTGSTSKTNEVLAFAPLSSAEWGIMVSQSEEEALGPLREMQRNMVLAGLLVLAMSVPLAWVGLRGLLRPLRSLQASSQRIAGGDLDTRVSSSGEADIAALGRTLDEMRLKLKQSQQLLEERVRQRTHELSALVNASQSLTSTQGLPDLLDSVMAIAVDTFENADDGMLLLYDSESRLLVPKSAIGYDREKLRGVRLAPDEGLAGIVFQSGKAVVCRNQDEVASMLKTISESNRLLLLEARGRKNLTSMVSVPLELQGRTMGSLVLTSAGGDSSFSYEEVPFISSFAALAAIMIERQRLLAEARQAEHLRDMDRAKTEFLSNVSHELRTPLTSIMVSAESLVAADAGGVEDSPRVKLLQNIRRNATRLNKLVGDLLDISQLQTGMLKLTLEPMQFREAVRESVDTVRPLADEKKVSLVAPAPHDLLLVKADHGRLVQVLINLLTNAVSFTPENGSVHLSVRAVDGCAEVSVSDTGVGIAEEEQERVFDRFYRSPRARKKGSMGLGLSITRALVELQGGTISLRSKPQQGSTFTFTIPLAEEERDESPDH